MDKIDVLMELSAYGRDDLCEWANNNLQEKDGSAAPEWMPIETAPTDGAEVLLYCENTGIKIVSGYWDDHPRCRCWVAGGYMQKIAPPKYWMHLPKPPTKYIPIQGAKT